MIKSFNGLIFALVGGLSIAVVSTSFGPKIIGLIIFILIIFAILLHVVVYLRNRIRIKIIKQNLFNTPYSIKFEAINLSERPNSLGEKIYFKSLLPNIRKGKLKNGEPYKCSFYLKDIDRLLEPHKPKIFTAYTKSDNPRLPFSWFRKYEFRPSRGIYSTVFVRNALDNGIPYWQYRIERSLYRLFRIVLDTKEVTTE
jgi:hypothetical protein